MTAPRGQTSQQAGPWPRVYRLKPPWSASFASPTRWRHSSHFTIFGTAFSNSNFATLNGQAIWQ